jgi:hypothetical protein
MLNKFTSWSLFGLSCNISLMDYGYIILFCSFILFILYSLIRDFQRRSKAGSVLVNCEKTFFQKLSIIFIIEIFFAIIQINQIIKTSQPSSLLIFFASYLFTFILTLIYFALVGLKEVQIRERGVRFVFDFVPWKEIEHYHLVPINIEQPGYIIFKLKIYFPLASQYRAIRIPIRHWNEVCNILEQKLSDKRI